jgi:hypothetical protein
MDKETECLVFLRAGAFGCMVEMLQRRKETGQ